jgi:FkbM family methyltransferase
MDSMATRGITSLITDEILTRSIGWMRRRVAQSTPFHGIIVPIDDHIGQRVIATGRFEATQLEGITQLLQAPESVGISAPDGIFVDVGANIGLYTIALHRFFKKTIAIEANPLTFSILQANVALRKLDDTECICIAASNASGEASISFPSNGNLGWATISPKRYDCAIEIKKRPLDEILSASSRIGMIKIDVERHEREVIEGARNILQRDRPMILFEFLASEGADDCSKILTECGYSRFFRFSRKLGWRTLFSGCDVAIDEISIESLQQAPLICAV